MHVSQMLVICPYCGPRSGQNEKEVNHLGPQKGERQRQKETSECNCSIFPSQFLIVFIEQKHMGKIF